MPTSEAPAEVNEPKGPAAPTPETGSPVREVSIPGGFLGLTAPLNPIPPSLHSGPDPGSATPGPDNEPDSEPPSEPGDSRARSVRGSRWVDYDTHELLEMISELEDERRWGRLREGSWLAILVHIVLLSAITWIPTYLFKVPKVVDPFDALKQHSDMTFLNLPPDVLRQRQKVAPKPLPKQPLIDKKTLDEMKLGRSGSAASAPRAAAGSGAAQAAARVRSAQSAIESQVEAPRPSAVPARPSFAMGSAESRRPAPPGHAERHARPRPAGSRRSAARRLVHAPRRGYRGVQILSDTQGVDFSSWLARWHYITQRTWDPLIPDEVNPPILKSGVVAIRFKVLPNGQVTDMHLGRPLRRHRPRSRGLGRHHGFELSPAAPRFPRPLPRAARLFPLQHAAALVPADRGSASDEDLRYCNLWLQEVYAIVSFQLNLLMSASRCPVHQTNKQQV